jgi:hypothetical protein
MVSDFKLKFFEMRIKFLFFLFTLICNFGYSQFSYNPLTGAFTYDYDPCSDPCVIANTDDCAKKKNMKKCFEDCDNKPLSDKEWLACRAKCRILDSQIRVNKRPTGFIAMVQFTTNTNNPSNFRTFAFNNGVTPSGWIPIISSDPSFSGQAPIYFGYYCYRYFITIVYDDGSQCTFDQPNPFQWVCSQ